MLIAKFFKISIFFRNSDALYSKLKMRWIIAMHTDINPFD